MFLSSLTHKNLFCKYIFSFCYLQIILYFCMSLERANMNKELSEIHSEITDNEITIIGIATTISGFSLAQDINTLFETKLKLFKDFESYNKEIDQITYFKNYYYYNPLYRLKNFLIANKNNDNKILIGNKNLIKTKINFDYIYILIGRDHVKYAEKFADQITKIPNISLIKTIYPSQNINKNNKIQNLKSQTLNLFEEKIITPKISKTNKKEKKENLNISQFIEDIEFNLGNAMFEKRIFLAYKFSVTKKLLEQRQNIISHFGFEDFNPTSIENYHLTLHFIGNTSVKQMQKIIVICQEIFKDNKQEEIEISIDKVDYFEIKKNNLVVYFGIEKNIYLEKIKQKLVEVFNDKNITQLQPQFTPHITIGKIKNLSDKTKKEEIKKLFSIEKQTLTLSPVILFESISIDNSIRYDIVQIFD